MDALLRDLRYTVRNLRGTLRLSLAAVACIAVGTGGAAFILAVADAILRQPPPFPDAPRLARVWTVRDGTGEKSDLSYLDARDVAERARSFDAVELVARTRAAVATASGTERVRGESVTPGYFGLVAATPALGRPFTPDEYAPDAPRVMILGHALWVRLFGARADAIGATVRARGTTGGSDEQDRLFTVVGVMPPEFAGTVDQDRSEFWLPIEQYAPRPRLDRRRSRMVWALARMRPGVTVAAAHAEVAAIGRDLAARHPEDYRELSLAAEPVGESWRERFRLGLSLLGAAAGLLLLVGCVNVAYLLLARLAQREGELGLRLALGASRGSIVRQLLIESLLLTAAGGAAGTALAVWGVEWFARARLFALPPYVPLSVSAGAVAVSSGVVLLTALLSGALPAWLGSRVEAAGRQLRESAGRGATLARRQRRVIDGLVAAEVAFSFLLLAGSALMVRSYANLVGSDLGFRTGRLQRLAVSLDPVAYPDAGSRLAFARDAGAALAALPDVRGVAFVAGVLPPWEDTDVALAVGGVPVPALSAVNRHPVSDEFFGVMEIALREGRTFGPADRAGSRRVAVVSRSLARALAGGDGRGALGRVVQVVRDPRPGAPAADADGIEVVGVVEDVRYHGPRAGRRADLDLYLPLAQAPGAILSIAVATAREPHLALGTLRGTLGRLAPTSPLHWVSTMEAELALQFGDARLYAWLTAVFGGSALLLVTIGLYGVISHAVTRRLAELGVRLAVGARPRDIVLLVLGQAARPLLLGVAAGAAAALGAATLASSLVFGLAPTDPATFLGVGVVLLAIGLAASYFPARRATRLDISAVLHGR